MPPSSKLDTLVEAGVLTREEADNLPPDAKQDIETMTDEQIKALVSGKAKLGRFPGNSGPGGGPVGGGPAREV